MSRSRTASLGLALGLLAALALRLPSIAQPAGGDQGLYLYEAQRVLAGDVPYRDVWDQKPPGIAFLYAGLWSLWPHESIVPIADLAAAGGVAWLLVVIGRRRGNNVGYLAAALFLVFGDPSIRTLSGIYLRGQCEPFIALAVTAAIASVSREQRRPWHLVLSGVFLAAAFWLKYNAATFALPIALAIWAWTPDGAGWRAVVRAWAWVAAGFAIIGTTFLAYFAAHGALHDLWLATIDYNLHYSDETYSGISSMLAYPFQMLFDRARFDMLWFLAGLGAPLLLGQGRPRRSTIVWLGWLAAAVLSIAINGQRNAPNYFVQAHPALAFVAAAGLATLRVRGVWSRYATAGLLVLGLWRVGVEPPTAGLRWGGLPEVFSNIRYDLSYVRGNLDRDRYLSRFKGVKHNALEVETLSRFVRETTSPEDRIYVFGFSGGSVGFKSARKGASRFFWSRPILVGFAADQPGYGPGGLLADLELNAPVLVALQREEWKSEMFFLNNERLNAWLRSRYVLDHETVMFSVWRRRN